jgi:hypothetical protein
MITIVGNALGATLNWGYLKMSTRSDEDFN